MSLIFVASNLLLGIFMCWIIFQDFKSRTLNLYVAIGVFITSFILTLDTYSWNWVVEVMLYNLLLLICFYVLFLLFYYFKGITVSQVFEDKLGLGDVIFTIAIIPCFITGDFLKFLLLSFLFSIIIYQVLKFSKVFKLATIPLAGNMALFFILTQILIKFGIREPINSLI